MQNSLTIRITDLAGFSDRFAKLARKAEKLSLPVPAFNVISETTEKVDVISIETGMKTGRFENVIVTTVEVTGLAPVKVNGWDFVATLENLTGNNNIAYTAPGKTLPKSYLSTGCACDHCQINRERKNTYVITNGIDYKQVGGTCLKDFLGNNSPANVAQVFEFQGFMFEELAKEGSERFGMGGTNVFSLFETICNTIALIEKSGWVSGKTALEKNILPTSHYVQLTSVTEKLIITEKHEEKAKAVIDFFKGLKVEEHNDYMVNLSTFAKAGFLTVKGFGLVCSMPAAFDRHNVPAIPKETQTVSDFVGKVGDKMTFSGTVLKVLKFQSHFGLNVMTMIKDVMGNVIVAKDLGADEGTNVEFFATVSDHTIYNNVKQTKVLRAKNVKRI